MKRTLFPIAIALILSGSLALSLEAQQSQIPDAGTQSPAPIVRTPAGQQTNPEQSGAMGKPHHARSPHHEAMELSRKLNLSADQTARIEPILADRQQKIATLQADSSLSDADRHAQMKTIHKTSKQQLDAVLTPEQREQMSSMHHGHKGGDQAQPMTPPPAAL